VRAFRDPEIAHGEGSLDPKRDIATMEIECLLADMEVAQRRLEKLELNIKKMKNKDDEIELPILRRCLAALEAETPIRSLDLKPDEIKKMRGYAFLTAVAPGDPQRRRGRRREGRLDRGEPSDSKSSRRGRAPPCARSPPRSRRRSPGSNPPTRAPSSRTWGSPSRRRSGHHAAFGLLGLIQFLTAGEDECAAGRSPPARAPRRRPARSTPTSSAGSSGPRWWPTAIWSRRQPAAAREKAQLRAEGRDYVVQDGDVINFRFNV